MIKTKYFGMIAEKLQLKEEEIDFSTCKFPLELKSFFTQRYPQIEQLPFVVAVNHEVKQNIQSLENINEIVILPPFAGG